MNVLNQFSIPYKGLGIGVHDLSFKVDDVFFESFENPHIDNGSFDVEVIFDKGHGMSTLDFKISGTTKSNCDRCMENIDLPVNGRYTLRIKLGEEDDSNDEVMFVHPEISILNIAQIVYEYIAISVPMIKSYDCDLDNDPPCNFEVLKHLDEKEEEDDNSGDGPSVWGSLKNIKFE